jgi:transposase
LDGTGKRGVQASDYLGTGVRTGDHPAFQGLLGYEGYRAKQEEDKEWGLYVEDHAPVHGAKKALVEAKRVLEIPLHERPSSSPDLNPIENVWRILKQRIKQQSRFPSTLSGMKQAVQEEWDKLQPSDFNKYIDSMQGRIDQLRQRKGM